MSQHVANCSTAFTRQVSNKERFWSTVLNNSDESKEKEMKPLTEEVHEPYIDKDSGTSTADEQQDKLRNDLGSNAILNSQASDSNNLQKANLTCSYCSRTFKRKYDLEHHISAVHVKDKPHRCSACGQSFGHSGTLTKHYRTVHLGERPFACSTCSRRFSERGNLNKHTQRCKLIEAKQVTTPKTDQS